MRKEVVMMIVVSIFVTAVIFWKIPFKGLVPFPGNLLVGRMFPWNTMEWSEYPAGVPYKEFISADTLRQTYPWRQLAIEQLKQGKIPWWNPYAFAGTPLLANMQSAPFYPLNVIYWLTSFENAWIIQVLSQTLLAMVGMYLFLRQQKLSTWASTFGGISFAFSGYLLVWYELNTVGHAAAWLPWILLFLQLAQKRKIAYLGVFIGLVSSFFANHLQTTFFVWLLSFIYFGYLTKENFGKNSRIHVVSFLVTLGASISIISFQLVPGITLLNNSARAGSDATIFEQFLLPWSHTVTFLIPNYFGNPATNNYFGKDYGEFMAYFGVLAFVLAVSSLLVKDKKSIEKLFIGIFALGFLLAVSNPVAWLPYSLHLPILQSSAPARWIFMVQLAGVVLASFGFDRLRKFDLSVSKAQLIVGAGMYLIIAITLIQWLTASDVTAKAQYMVSLRNSAVPVLAITIAVIGYYLARYINKKQPQVATTGMSLLWIAIPILGYSIFANKYLPFSSKEFMFPQTPIFSKVQDLTTMDRFYGDYTAQVNSNVWMPYNMYGVEGYDSLYLKHYGTLVAAAKSQGDMPDSVPRSDAALQTNTDDFYRQRLQDVLGVTYLLDKNDFPQSDWEEDPMRFPPERYQLVWQEGKFKIYENKQALPRIMVVPTYEVIESQTDMLNRFYDPEWDPQMSVLLSEPPVSTVLRKKPTRLSDITPEELKYESQLTINDYQSDLVSLSITTDEIQFIVLSDAYDSNWQAFIDGNQVPVLQANHSFKAVVVPNGEHLVEFKYTFTDLPWSILN